VDVAAIKANYAAAGMDKCLSLTPTVSAKASVSKSVILVIDASGSMDGTKIDQAKSAAKNLLGSMGAGQEVGLMVFYDCGSISWTPFSTDFSSFIPIVDAIYASGGTPLGASIRSAGARLSQEASGKEGVIIVLTDGGESCGDNPVDAASTVYQMTLPRKISRRAPLSVPVAYAAGGDIVVSVIGFDIGDSGVEQQLRDIATAGGGEFFTANNVDELNTALKQAAGSNAGMSTLLLVGGGIAACVLPLLLLLVVVVVISSRRRRRPAPVPVGYGYAPPPAPYASQAPAPGSYPAQVPVPYPQQPSAPGMVAQRPPVPGPYPAQAPAPYAPQAPGPQPSRVAGRGELVLLRGQAQPAGLLLSLPVVRMGRSQQGNHAVIQDPMASGAHAEIYVQGGGHYIRDLRSTNGTYVNGARVAQPQPLRDGDHIVLGNTEWVYRQ